MEPEENTLITKKITKKNGSSKTNTEINTQQSNKNNCEIKIEAPKNVKEQISHHKFSEEENKKYILALDPATSTGYCLVEITNKKANIYEYGIIDVDISSEYQGDHCINLMDQIQTILNKHKITTIVIENYFFSNKFRQGSCVNAAFRTAIHILARNNNIDYIILSITEWKKYIAGRSNPTKEQKKQWGINAKKIYIQDALWYWWGFKFPNHSISPNTGKPISFRYDVVDVVAQATYYCGIFLRIPYENITMTVDVPEDVIFKRKVKKCYVYS